MEREENFLPLSGGAPRRKYSWGIPRRGVGVDTFQQRVLTL
ncbi:MAG: hypothetical protein Q8M44_07160 [bacterium]|nr:hypothetical protein [bacterium]